MDSRAWLGFVLALAGCGADDDGGDDAAGTSGASTMTQGSEASSTDPATDDTASETSTTATDDTGGPIACGDASACKAAEICLQQVFLAMCTPYDPDTETCPRDTVATRCPGPSNPCCCGDTPPPAFACVPIPSCPEGIEDLQCECVQPLCGPADECLGPNAERTFTCQPTGEG